MNYLKNTYIVFIIFCFYLNTDAQQKKLNQKINIDKTIVLKKIKPSIIIIQPFNGIPNAHVLYIYNKLKLIFPQVVLNKSIPLPKRAYFKPRNRYKADTLNLFLKERTKNGCVTIGLTNKDISTKNEKIPDWGVMGLSILPGKACTVSTFRLSKKNTEEQYFKIAIHELGHTQGLYHCPDKLCMMTAAEGKNNTDKEKGFCEKCKAFLEKKGWNLKDL